MIVEIFELDLFGGELRFYHGEKEILTIGDIEGQENESHFRVMAVIFVTDGGV